VSPQHKEHKLDETLEELQRILDQMGCSISPYLLTGFASLLDKHRGGDMYGHGCLRRGGGGVFTWLKSRLQEHDLLSPCNGEFAIPDSLVTGVLHFESWDVERYGEWADRGSVVTVLQEMRAGVQRSPLSRLKDASPINRTAHKIAMRSEKQCVYCNKRFRNPAALLIHLKTSHGGELSILG